MPRKDKTTGEFERAIKAKEKRYTLTLYVASMNARARFAIENIKKICEERLEGRYDLEVVDLREDPSRALKDGISATPVLVKRLPPPLKSFIGNMADIDKILVGLQVKPKENATKE